MPLGQHALWPVNLLGQNHLAFGTYRVSARRITTLSAMASPLPCQPNSSALLSRAAGSDPRGVPPRPSEYQSAHLRASPIAARERSAILAMLHAALTMADKQLVELEREHAHQDLARALSTCHLSGLPVSKKCEQLSA